MEKNDFIPNRFDTIKLGLPIDECKIVLSKEIYRKILLEKKLLNTPYFIENYGLFGINLLKVEKNIWDKKDHIILTISAKLLGDRYYELFFKDNIGRVVKILKDYDIMEIDVIEFLRKAIVHRCDITEDIRCGDKYLESLKRYPIYHKFKRENYQTNVDITKKIKSNFIHVAFYHKNIELINKQKDFLKSYPTQKILTSFMGKYRLEITLKKYAVIRKYLGITSTRVYSAPRSPKPIRLKQVLLSKKNPCKEILYNTVFQVNKNKNLYLDFNKKSTLKRFIYKYAFDGLVKEQKSYDKVLKYLIDNTSNVSASKKYVNSQKYLMNKEKYYKDGENIKALCDKIELLHSKLS